ncbi:MAG: hypothetical protein EZS28_016809 [Streblomastix strix]|uniref:Uncharacterized protein n=1 Tax=Streblomastix strix TaxID=222440 RepID=A0A5J4VZK2_9EUKA|nr:MAG: hypothetical protein EZS28_016809 [Streblomastix strix]
MFETFSAGRYTNRIGLEENFKSIYNEMPPNKAQKIFAQNPCGFLYQSDDNHMQRDEKHIINDDIFGQTESEGMQSELQISGQRRCRRTSTNETINPSAQSSRIKQIAGGNDYNIGSSMDIDIEQVTQ